MDARHPLHELGVQLDPTAPAPRYAYLYNGGTKSAANGGRYNLYILALGEHLLGRAGEDHYLVAGKREARAICKTHGATPWNF
jgi:hypothetical protein